MAVIQPQKPTRKFVGTWLTRFFNLVLALFIFSSGYFVYPHLLGIYNRIHPYSTNNYASLLGIPTNKNVVVFTSSQCIFCKKLKYILEKNHIAYNEYVIDESPLAKELYLKLGEKATPISIYKDRRFKGTDKFVIDNLVSYYNSSTKNVTPFKPERS